MLYLISLLLLSKKYLIYRYRKSRFTVLRHLELLNHYLLSFLSTTRERCESRLGLYSGGSTMSCFRHFSNTVALLDIFEAFNLMDLCSSWTLQESRYQQIYPEGHARSNTSSVFLALVHAGSVDMMNQLLLKMINGKFQKN